MAQDTSTASGAADFTDVQYLEQMANHYASSPVPEIRAHQKRLRAIAAALASAAAPAQQPNTACAALPAECDSPELCAVSRSCAGQFGTKRICASREPAPAGAAPEVLDKATKHSRLKYTLTTSRAAFQAGALFALNTMRDQPAPAPGVQWQCGPQASGFTAPQPTQAQAGAVPPEAEPIVLNCEAPGDLKPGDYVFASRWSDCDPGDPWEVGFVSEVGVYPESMTKAGYVVLQGGSRRWGRAMRITPEQGLRICEQFPSMERLPQDYDAIARVFGIKGGQHVGNVD